MSSSLATKFSEYIKPRLNRRSVAFIACLALSALFWLLTSLSEEYVDEIGIAVSYSNIPEDVIVINELTPTVTAQAKGIGFNLFWYWVKFEQLEIPVNADPAHLRSYKQDGQLVHYLLTDNTSRKLFGDQDEQLEIQNISPDTLYLKFRPKYSKMVPVRLDAEISFDKQFGMIENAKIEPDSILLTGLREELDTIHFVLTESQSWNELDESISTEIKLKDFDDLPLAKMSTSEVNVELNVVEFTEGTVSIPLNIISQNPGSVKVFPSIVDIAYQVPLAAYDAITSDQFQASVVVDNLESGQSRLTVNIDRQPEYVKGLRINPSQVEFIIQK